MPSLKDQPTRFHVRALMAGVFFLLFLSYANFWQGRDWNTASRLMLTYALIDRGTIRLDGLSEQTRDIAFFEGQYYTDKLPGFSMLAVPAYTLARAGLRLAPHPLDQPGMTHWPADYWTTLGTSGLATATLGAWMVGLSIRLGCPPRGAVLLGLGYGLATPAYVYATLAYGHQLTAVFLFVGMSMLIRSDQAPNRLQFAMAGFLSAMACLVELQSAPAAAVIGLLAATLAVRHRSIGRLGWLLLGGLPPLLVLALYNFLAFGNPLDMGYFHHATAQFAQVHSEDNPLGLTGPVWSRAMDLLWGGYRGLAFYAPIVVLAPLGWALWIGQRRWKLVAPTLGICLAVFLVNLSYPEWTGGWSTGPRLLVPLLPFAVIAVSGWLERTGSAGLAVALAAVLAGFVLMTLFLGVGGRIAQDIPDPLRQAVLPAWLGQPARSWASSERFVRHAVAWWFPDWVGGLPRTSSYFQFLPLIAIQCLGGGLLLVLAGRRVEASSNAMEPRP